MTFPAPVQFDPHSSLLWIYDALHGSIDTLDAYYSEEVGTITRLLRSPVLERLRRVKQLGFASQSYPAADHSRYAHALGTMHVMRKILDRLDSVDGLQQELFTALKTAFPDRFSQPDFENRALLVQHMLIAALLQDIGELPYAQATKLFYRPSESLRNDVRNLVGLDIHLWNDKSIFAIGCLYNNSILNIINDLSIQFLVYLITGYSNFSSEIERGLKPLRNMMDGVVDADRLDYVFRDAYHTLGIVGSANAVIESLLYYDETGVVLSDPGPVSNFLATRAHLYSAVYLSPATRFHTILLVNLLQDIVKREECAREFFSTGSNGELSIEDFIELDDVSITTSISSFSLSNAKRRLDKRAQHALEILAGHEVGYECFWLPPPTSSHGKSQNINIPNDLFWDTYTNQNRPLYAPNSVRIKANQYKYFRETIPLEQCGGPLVSMFKENWSVLPMPDSILLFVPKKQVSNGWKKIQQAIDENWLYETLLEKDPLGPVNFTYDTRNLPNFVGPNIFVSFAWLDIRFIGKIAKILYKRHRHYYMFVEPNQGLGNTPSTNSTEGVKQAQAVLIIVSSNYAARYREAPDGYIAKEIFEMSKKVSSDNLPVVVLSVDDHKEVYDKLPWSQFGLDEAPFTGKPIKFASNMELELAVDEILEVIDQKSNQ